MEAEVPDGLVALVHILDDPREQERLAFEVWVLHRGCVDHKRADGRDRGGRKPLEVSSNRPSRRPQGGLHQTASETRLSVLVDPRLMPESDAYCPAASKKL